jgi:hypothetical protein
MDQATKTGWRFKLTDRGAWLWFYDLGNGWSAGVADDSAVGDIARRTTYRVFASDRDRFIEGPEYEKFADAKQHALELAMEQNVKKPGKK